MSGDVAGPEFMTLQRLLAGRYSLDRELGRGGMGVVFLAREIMLDRLVAIKLLPAHLAHDSTFRDRFLREARTAAMLAHPNIVAIHSVESVGDHVFFVMEYIAGESLGSRLRREGAIGASDVLRIAQEVAWALAHAHARGVVHRDIKPDNILLEEGTGRAVVTDLGIAHMAVENTVTGAQAPMGTLHYISPEQLSGEKIDGRADIYALGVSAFQAVAGRRPFEGVEGAALLARQLHGDPPSVLDFLPTLSARRAAAIDRAVRRSPDDRWPSADALARELAELRAETPALPPVLRQFSRRALAARDRIELAAGSIAVLGLMMALFSAKPFSDWVKQEGDFSYAWIYVEVLVIVLLMPLVANLVLRIRQISKAGYSRTAAVLSAHQLRVDETPPLRRAQRLLHRMPIAALMLALGVVDLAAGVAASYLPSEALPPPFDTLLPLVLLLALIAGPVVVIRQQLVRRRGLAPSLWSRFAMSQLGARVWRFLTIGIAPAPESDPASILAARSSILASYAALERDHQAQLQSIPDLAARLEARSLALGGSDRTIALTALETLRLEMARLRVGELEAQTFTEIIRQIREIGRRVDDRVRLDAIDPLADS